MAFAAWLAFSLMTDEHFLEGLEFLRMIAIGLAPLLAIGSVWGLWDVRRKKAVFCEASLAYEHGLRKAFAELTTETEAGDDEGAGTPSSPHDRPKTA